MMNEDATAIYFEPILGTARRATNRSRGLGH